MGRRYPIGIALSITMLLVSAAFGGTFWRYENAQQQSRRAAKESAHRVDGQRAALAFWHQREAINEYLIIRSPAVHDEIASLRAEFFRITDTLADDGNEAALISAAQSANRRLFKEFEMRAHDPRYRGMTKSAIASLHPFEEAVLAPLRVVNARDLVSEREGTQAADAAAREAKIAAVLGALLALAAGLGFAVYVSRLLREVTRQAGVLETFEERERTHAEVQERELKLRQAQKMEAVGRLAGGVAHDFNNVLLAITGYGSLALKEVGPEQSFVRHALEQIELAAGRAAAMTKQLLAFSRQQVLQTQVIEVNDLVERLMAMLRPLLGATVDLQVELDPSAGAVGTDAGQLEQVITNLVVNGRDAMPTGGVITIRTAKADASEVPSGLAPGAYAAISVSDTGEGMNKETQSRALDPFFTTKEQGKGTGLGLATVHGIVTQSGGELRIDSAPGAGTTIVVYLPASDEAPEVAPTESTAEPEGGAETVLLVEDDLVVQSLLHDVLARAHYDVLVAGDGAGALTMAAQAGIRPDLLITDIVMPGIGGRELARQLQSMHPKMRAIYMSGHSDDASLYEDADAGRITFLQKPFAPNDMLSAVRAVLDPPVP